MINLLWLVAIAAALGFGSVPGLLAILCLFVMDGVLELKMVRAHVAAVAAVFAVEPEPMSEEKAEEMTTTILQRVQSDLKAQAARRPH